VTIGNTCSNIKSIGAGVPQGSVLAPTLFNIFINDLTKIKVKASCSMFEDDTGFFISSFRIDTIAKHLSIALAKSLKYFNKWKTKPK
jgi:hypothetical protein